MFLYILSILHVFLAVKAGPLTSEGISVIVKGPELNITSLEDLQFVAEVTNYGPQEVEIFKYATVLDHLPTRSFVITKGGDTVDFIGAKVHVRLDENAYVHIPVGHTVSVVHHIGRLYDFEAAGPGDFSFHPIIDFQAPRFHNASIRAQKAHKIKVFSEPITVTIPRIHRAKERRTAFTCVDRRKRAFIKESYVEAKTLAAYASSYIYQKGPEDPLYKAYFKSRPTTDVIRVFDLVSAEDGMRTYSCEDVANACEPGVVAYTMISTTDIYYCGVFFAEVPTSRLCVDTSAASRNVRGGTTLHEITHATSSTTDVNYGCDIDQTLTTIDSANSADNYNCFATEAYAKNACTMGRKM